MEYTQEIQNLADQCAREQEDYDYEFITSTYVGVKDGVALFVPMEEDSKYFEKRFFGMIAVSESGAEFISYRDDRVEDYHRFYHKNILAMSERGLEVYRSLIRRSKEGELSKYDTSYVNYLLSHMPDPDGTARISDFYCDPQTFLIYLEAAERIHEQLRFVRDTKNVPFISFTGC